MDVQEYFNEMKKFQFDLLQYLDAKKDPSDNVHLISYLKDKMNHKNKEEIKETLYLILSIANNYHRAPNFFDKIDLLLQNIKEEIKQTYSNFEIFNIFKSNKRILLFLIKESLIQIDQQIFDVINNNDYWNASYIKYFFFECKPFLSELLRNEIEGDLSKYDQETFEENRKRGENDDYICELIRKDSIDEFIEYVNQTNYSISSSIPLSIFETNQFLLQNGATIVKYAAFFGSVRIFKYLFLNKVDLMASIWSFAIHGNNAEVIHLLEDNHINPIDRKYEYCLEESIKCYSNNMANYFLNTYLNDKLNNELCFKYHNYEFFPDNIQQPFVLYYLCSYNYIYFVEKFLQNTTVNINEKIITEANLENI